MLAPEVQNDPEVIDFGAKRAKSARFNIGICNGVLVFGAAVILKDRSVTASHNALPILNQLSVREAIAAAHGVPGLWPQPEWYEWDECRETVQLSDITADGCITSLKGDLPDVSGPGIARSVACSPTDYLWLSVPNMEISFSG